MESPRLLSASFAPRSLAVHAAAIGVSQIVLSNVFDFIVPHDSVAEEAYLCANSILLSLQVSALTLHYQVVKNARLGLRQYSVGCFIASWCLALLTAWTQRDTVPHTSGIAFFGFLTWLGSFAAAVIALSHFDDYFIVRGFAPIAPPSRSDFMRFTLRELFALITVIAMMFAAARQVLSYESPAYQEYRDGIVPRISHMYTCCCIPSFPLFVAVFVPCWGFSLMSARSFGTIVLVMSGLFLPLLSLSPLLSWDIDRFSAILVICSAILSSLWHACTVESLKRYGLHVEKRMTLGEKRRAVLRDRSSNVMEQERINPAPESPGAPLPEKVPSERESNES